MQTMAANKTKPDSAKASAKNLSYFEKLILEHVRGAKIGTLHVTLPNGYQETISRTPQPEVHWNITTDKAINAIATGGALGFGEAYVDGGWQTPNLTRLLFFFLENVHSMANAFRGERSRLANITQIVGQRLLKFKQRNSVSRSKQNILAHYDLSNQFYSLWLDETMTYSSAFINQETFSNALEQQQELKFQRILDQLQPKENDHILEIGCGWGGFANYASQQGYKVTGITVSDAQFQYAQKKLQNDNNVQIKLLDYRKLTGRYDHIVSIEMIEAVGKQYWPTYFRKLKEVLKPGGRVVLQSILMNEKYYDDYKNGLDFIQAHIFPGGFLPTQDIVEQQANKAFLNVTDNFNFGADYAATLNKWHQSFQENWPKIQQLDPKFSSRFFRLWQYYLCYCEAGFLNGRIDVAQITLEHAKFS